jgi:hypothetical protein
MAYLYKFFFTGGKKVPDIQGIKFNTSFSAILIFLDKLAKQIHMVIERKIGGFKDVPAVVVEAYGTAEKPSICSHKF